MTTTMQEFLLKQKLVDLERENAKGDKANLRRVELLVLDIRELRKRIEERKTSDEAKRAARGSSRLNIAQLEAQAPDAPKPEASP